MSGSGATLDKGGAKLVGTRIELNGVVSMRVLLFSVLILAPDLGVSNYHTIKSRDSAVLRKVRRTASNKADQVVRFLIPIKNRIARTAVAGIVFLTVATPLCLDFGCADRSADGIAEHMVRQSPDKDIIYYNVAGNAVIGKRIAMSSLETEIVEPYAVYGDIPFTDLNLKYLNLIGWRHKQKVSIDQIGGQIVPDHPDALAREKVYFRVEDEDLTGRVFAVFDDGARAILATHFLDKDKDYAHVELQAKFYVILSEAEFTETR